MRYAYPCDIVPDQEELRKSGRTAYGVIFPDVYGANSFGWSWEEAIEMAEDCLGVALSAYMDLEQDIPPPSPPAEGQVVIPVPAIMAAKLALYTAMREQRVTKEELGARLHLEPGAVRKLLNPGYRSHLTHLENALHAVGCSLVVEDSIRIPAKGDP